MLFKYSMLQIFKKPSRFFWGLVFPLVLGTLYFIAFGQAGTNAWTDIPVAVVKESTNDSFVEFLEGLEDSYLDLNYVSNAEAIQMLKDGEVDGIYYVKAEPTCTILESGNNQTILTEIYHSYIAHTEIIQDVMKEHPEKLLSVIEEMKQEFTFTKSVSLGGKSYDNTLNYFFALIAMACFFGSFLGNELAEENAANKSAIGARRSVSPLPKQIMVLNDMFCGILVHFTCVVILLCYLRYVLGVNFSGNMGGMLLICFLGSLTGICFGIAIGCSSHVKKNAKDLVLAIVPLVTSFLAGLMAGGIKDTIEKSCPLINRINPATLVSDAFYCLVVYDDPTRLTINLVTLAGISFALMLFAFLSMRRVRYDSI